MDVGGEPLEVLMDEIEVGVAGIRLLHQDEPRDRNAEQNQQPQEMEGGSEYGSTQLLLSPGEGQGDEDRSSHQNRRQQPLREHGQRQAPVSQEDPG